MDHNTVYCCNVKIIRSMSEINCFNLTNSTNLQTRNIDFVNKIITLFKQSYPKLKAMMITERIFQVFSFYLGVQFRRNCVVSGDDVSNGVVLNGVVSNRVASNRVVQGGVLCSISTILNHNLILTVTYYQMAFSLQITSAWIQLVLLKFGVGTPGCRLLGTATWCWLLLL